MRSGAPGAVPLDDLDRHNRPGDTGAGVAVEGDRRGVGRGAVGPGGVRGVGGVFVGMRHQVGGRRAAPDVGGAAGAAAAVGVEDRLRRAAVERDDDAGRAFDGGGGRRRPPGRGEPAGLEQLAMRRRAQVEAVTLVPAAV